MTIDPMAPMLQTMPLQRSSNMSRGRRWFNQVVAQCAQPVRRDKPLWVHLPDRVWRRQSALLMSLHDLKHEE